MCQLLGAANPNTSFYANEPVCARESLIRVKSSMFLPVSIIYEECGYTLQIHLELINRCGIVASTLVGFCPQDLKYFTSPGIKTRAGVFYSERGGSEHRDAHTGHRMLFQCDLGVRQPVRDMNLCYRRTLLSAMWYSLFHGIAIIFKKHRHILKSHAL